MFKLLMEFCPKLNPAFELMYLPDAVKTAFVFESNILIENDYLI